MRIEAMASERWRNMVIVLARALRRHGLGEVQKIATELVTELWPIIHPPDFLWKNGLFEERERLIMERAQEEKRLEKYQNVTQRSL